MGLLQCLLNCVLQRDDSPDAVQRKRVTLIIAPAAAIGCLVSGFVNLARGVPLSRTSSQFLGGVVAVALIAQLFCTRRAPLKSLEVACISWSFSTIIGDWSLAAEVGSMRTWSYAILIMDVLLTIGASRTAQAICVHSLAVWLFASAVEDGARLGLYDIAGWTEMYPDPDSVADTHCANPPCARGTYQMINRAWSLLACLYIDFLATRGFAEGQQREKQRVTAMVRVAEQVAACLVRFDLAAGAHGLSPELGSSFRSLLSNLSGYRPYLPQSCFEDQDGEETSAEGSESGTIATTRSHSASSRGSVASSATGGSSTRGSPPQSFRKHASPPASFIKPSSSRKGRRSGDSSSHGSGSSALSAAARAPRIAHVLQQKRVSLLACNRSGFLAALRQCAASSSLVQSWAAAEVGRFSQVVLAQKGVVDLLSADHLHASFGALRALGAHRIAAVRCATQLTVGPPQESPAGDLGCIDLGVLPTTSAVCTGSAVCGDLGSETALRFMIIGDVSAFAMVLERVAAGWGSQVLVDQDVHSDAQTYWDCRMRKVVVFSKLSERKIALWEVRSAKRAAVRLSQTEWMYELSAAPPNPWVVYNNAVKQWCKGDAAGALVLTKEDAKDPTQAFPEVSEALQALEAALSEEVAGRCAEALKPVCHIPLAAGVGSGTPVLLGP